MKRWTLLITQLFLFTALHAQQNANCSFEKLFSLQKSSQQDAVVDSVKTWFDLKPFNIFSDVTTIRKDGFDTQVPSLTITYQLPAGNCIKGRNGKIEFVFADGKLVKAFVSAEYNKADAEQVKTDLNDLINVLNAGKLSGKKMKIDKSDKSTVEAYKFSPSKADKAKTSPVTVGYADVLPGNANSPYLLQMVWVNSDNSNTPVIRY